MEKRIQTDTADKQTSSSEREPGRGKPWLALGIILLLAGIVSSFWFVRDPETREEVIRRFGSIESIRETMTSSFQDVASTAQHFIANLKERFAERPPIPEIGGATGSSLPGAPPKRHSIETPEDLDKALAEQGPPQEGGAVERGIVVPLEENIPPPSDAGRKDDAVVRTDFVDDLAAWLVKGYRPPSKVGGTGTIGANLQALNLRYGMGMKGLGWVGNDISAGRAAALNYVYTPDMLSALYQLYINRFMEAVEQQLNETYEGKTFTSEQKKDFYHLYAKRFRELSGALQGVSALPDFNQKMDALREAAQKVVEANARYSELLFARDAAKEEGNQTAEEILHQRLDDASQSYRQAVVARERSRDDFAKAIRKNPAAATLDNETLLYIASWVERRVRNHPEKNDATLQAATLFLELAKQFETEQNSLQ